MAVAKEKKKSLLGDAAVRKQYSDLGAAIYSRIKYYLTLYADKGEARFLHVCKDGHTWLNMTQPEMAKRVGRSERQFTRAIVPLIQDGLITTLRHGRGLVYGIGTPVDNHVEKPVDNSDLCPNKISKNVLGSEIAETPYSSRDTEEKCLDISIDISPPLMSIDMSMQMSRQDIDVLTSDTPQRLEEPQEIDPKCLDKIEMSRLAINEGMSRQMSIDMSMQMSRDVFIYDNGNGKGKSAPQAARSLKPLLLKSSLPFQRPTPVGEGEANALGAPPPGTPQNGREPSREELGLSEVIEASLRSSAQREPMVCKLARRRLAWAVSEAEYLAWLASVRLQKDEKGWLLIFDTWFKADHVMEKFGPQISASLRKLEGEPFGVCCVGPKSDEQRAQNRLRLWLTDGQQDFVPGGDPEVLAAFDELRGLIPSQKSARPPVNEGYLARKTTPEEMALMLEVRDKRRAMFDKGFLPARCEAPMCGPLAVKATPDLEANQTSMLGLVKNLLAYTNGEIEEHPMPKHSDYGHVKGGTADQVGGVLG